MASALAYAGYDFKFVTGDKDHDMIQGGADLPRRPALALARLSSADCQACNATSWRCENGFPVRGYRMGRGGHFCERCA